MSSVFSTLQGRSHASSAKRKCPYEYEITEDGRLIIEGEDFGNAEECMTQGDKLRRLVREWHDVAVSQK